jgi:hypothetical protein
MRRKLLVHAALRTMPAVAISILASAASGEEFSWQLSGGYGETELTPFADTERTILDATYYLDPVDDSRGPYALAPFLNRSSRVTAGVTNEKTTLSAPVATIGPPLPGTPTTLTLTQETTGYAISGRYVWPGSGWYVGASYQDANTDHEQISPGSRQDTRTDGYQLFGGRYFGESTSVDLAAGATRQATELLISCITSLCLSASAATQVDSDDWSIGAVHVRQGSRLSYSITARVSRADPTARIDPLQLSLPPGAVDLTFGAPPTGLRAISPQGGFRTIAPAGGLTTIALPSGLSAVGPLALIAAPFTGPLPIPDERETYSIGGELFPTERLGFRIGLARSDSDFFDEESYDVAATWFFTRAMAVQFVLARTESARFTLRRDVDSAELRLFGRL